jgi:hypothetical protein
VKPSDARRPRLPIVRASSRNRDASLWSALCKFRASMWVTAASSTIAQCAENVRITVHGSSEITQQKVAMGMRGLP